MVSIAFGAVVDHTTAAWLKRFLHWMERFDPCLGYPAQRAAFRRYLRGVPSDAVASRWKPCGPA